MDHHVEVEYSKITDQVYLGQNMCCTPHFQDLIDLGVTADLSMQREAHTNTPGLQYYLNLPVDDEHAPTIEQFHSGIRFMNEVIERGEKVYVHCKNGHGRGPSMVIAYLISTGMSFDEASQFTMKARPEMHLNNEQVKVLQEFAGAGTSMPV